MSLSNIVNFLCAVALFLYGINLMSDNLSSLMDKKLKQFLSKLTKDKLSGIFTGFCVTSLIQSSCATCVLAQSFVNASLIELDGAIGVVMGANIGTTMTSVLVALDLSSLSAYAIIIGVLMKVFSKKYNRQSLGCIIIGFGLIFFAIDTMASSMQALKDTAMFSSLMMHCENKFFAVIIGFIMTSLMQSSSATISLTQVLVCTNSISLTSGVFMLFGQNIGAVMPSLISSFTLNKNARILAKSNLFFNVFGTVICFLFYEIFPIETLLLKIQNPSMRISFMHILFNVLSCIFVLPFIDRFVCKLCNQCH